MHHLFFVIICSTHHYNSSILKYTKKDSECDGIVQKSCLIWCIKWMVCYHELTYTTDDSGNYCCLFMVLYYCTAYDFRIKTMFGSSLPPFACRRTPVLFTVFVFFAYCGVQHVLWCPTRLVLCFLFCFSSYSMLPVTLDCPIWIAHSVFYYIYLQFCYFYHKLIVKVTIKLCYCISEYSTI
jgi:hypothetical protein